MMWTRDTEEAFQARSLDEILNEPVHVLDETCWCGPSVEVVSRSGEHLVHNHPDGA